MKSESDTILRLPVLGQLTYREWHAYVNNFYKGFKFFGPENAVVGLHRLLSEIRRFMGG